MKYEIWKEVIQCDAEIADAVVLDCMYPTGNEELVTEFYLLSVAKSYFERYCKTADISYMEDGTAVVTVWWLEKVETGDDNETCVERIMQSDLECEAKEVEA